MGPGRMSLCHVPQEIKEVNSGIHCYATQAAHNVLKTNPNISGMNLCIEEA